MPQPNDLSRSLVPLDQDSTIIAVVELSQSSWLVGGVVAGIERQPRKKLEPSPERLLALLHRWRDESVRAGRTITRDCGCLRSRPRRLLAGALAGGARGRGARDPSLECGRVAGTSPGKDRSARHRVVEARVPGVAAWRTGHCSMTRVPTIAEEDAKRPNRERGQGTHAACEP